MGAENNMATWAPSTGPDVQWVAFASKRDYGFVLCSPTSTTTSTCATTSKIGSGSDPSYPAFRVPFMELSENCHRPFWALDAIAHDDGAAGSGGMGGAGSGGAGSGGTGGSPACIANAGDCSSGSCCGGLECTPDANGDVFTCQFQLL